MRPFRSAEPPSPVTTGLTPEAAHARHILDVAAHGPPSTRGLVVGLMQSLVAEGFRTSVSWYLAPSPEDDLHEVIFSLRSGDETEDRRWRDRREIAALLADAQHRAQEGVRVEIWSGNGHGARRLVIANQPGSPLQFVTPELRHYAGEGRQAAAAVAAWRKRPPQMTTEAVPATDNEDEARRPVPTKSSALVTTDPVPRGLALNTPPAAPALDAVTLGAALQDALSQVQVEVDLGAMQHVVTEALRSALANPPPVAFGPPPKPEPASRELTTGEVPVVSTQPAVASTVDLEQLVERCVADTISSSLADRLPELVNQLGDAMTPLSGSQPGPPQFAELPSELEKLLASRVSESIDASLTRRLPELVDRLALSAAPPPADFERTTEPDLVDVARRVAASVLSPAEIAETLLFRLRPLLDEHNERTTHRESIDADRVRTTIEQMRASLTQLAERVDRRMKSLEAEVRHQRTEPFRVMQSDDGQ